MLYGTFKHFCFIGVDPELGQGGGGGGGGNGRTDGHID